MSDVASAVAFDTPADHFFVDHRWLEEIASRLRVAFAADEGDEVKALWNQFKEGIGAHLEAVETRFMPTLLRRSARDARTIAREHQHIRSRLAELGAGVDLYIVGDYELGAFVEELRAHARHEDAVLRRWNEACLGPADSAK